MRENFIIFYAFHDRPEITAHRLAQLTSLNNKVQIIASYGGPLALFDQTVEDIHQYGIGLGINFEKNTQFIYNSTRKPAHNIDLFYVDWYADLGHKYNFDMLMYIEHDVLMLNPISDVLRDQKDVDYVSHLTDSINYSDWYWLKSSYYRRFIEWRQTKFQISKDESILIAFAPIHFISRAALEKYADLYKRKELPVVHVEIRLPNVLNLLGFNVVNASFSRNIRWRPPYNDEELNSSIRYMKEKYPQEPLIYHPYYGISLRRM